MSPVMDESATFPADKTDWQTHARSRLEAGDPEVASEDQGNSDENTNPQRQGRNCPEMFDDFVGGLPSLAEVQAVRVWLYQPQQPSNRSHLLTAELSDNFPARMEAPLDDAV